jgi:hypothetical protein
MQSGRGLVSFLDKISSRNPKPEQVRTPRNPPCCFLPVHAPIYEKSLLENSLEFRSFAAQPHSSSIIVFSLKWAIAGGF